MKPCYSQAKKAILKGQKKGPLCSDLAMKREEM